MTFTVIRLENNEWVIDLEGLTYEDAVLYRDEWKANGQDAFIQTD